MGTRADFYVGRGEQAEWLGSIAWDGYPDGQPGNPKYGPVIAAASEPEFRERVANLLAAKDDGTTPDKGWPWPWENSRLTDWSYAFDAGQVWASKFGGPWHVPGEQPPEKEDSEYEADPCNDPARVTFPDMTSRKNVTLGKRSGVIVFGGEPGGPA
jgi:hypothetical protein